MNQQDNPSSQGTVRNLQGRGYHAGTTPNAESNPSNTPYPQQNRPVSTYGAFSSDQNSGYYRPAEWNAPHPYASGSAYVPPKSRTSASRTAKQEAVSPSGRPVYPSQAPSQEFPQPVQTPYQAQPPQQEPVSQPVQAPYQAQMTKQDSVPQPVQTPYQAQSPKQEKTPQPVKVPYQPQPIQRRRSPKHKLNYRNIVILVLAFAAVVAGVYIAASAHTNQQKINQAMDYISQYDSVFLDTVYVDGICLGGKNYEEGKALVVNQLQQKKNSWSIVLKNVQGESAVLTAGELGIGWDPTEALNEAWALGREAYSGNDGILQKQEELQNLLTQEHHFYSAEQSASTDAIDSILASLADAAYRAPTNAAYLGFDPDNFDSPFSFREETWGQMLDTTAIREQIFTLAQNFESGEILLETTPIQPSVTVEELQKNYTLRYKATTPISSKSSEERTANIRNAFSRINGTIVQSGSKFSFNTVVGNRTIANGFQYAVEYVYGEEELGIGGGVCQCSTTVYLAAVQSGLEIVKRRAHSLAVSYVDYGMDATVSDTKGHAIDFVFRNNTDYPIYILARVTNVPGSKKNLQCEVSIYGRTLENVSYKLVANTIETIPKPEIPNYVQDEKATYVVYTDQQKLVSKGHEGYVVESYLVTLIDGNEAGRQLLYTDTYPEKADTVYVGITERYDYN